MTLFLLIYILEASVRKYVIASSALVLIKYIPLSWYLRNLIPWTSLCILFLFSIPTTLTIPNISGIEPYAMFDLLQLIYFPLLLVAILKIRSIQPKVLQSILTLSTISSSLNSGFIILQTFLGPLHWLSQTVDQQNTQHVWQTATISLQKAPGILGTSHPYICIMGLVASLYYLSNSTSSIHHFLNTVNLLLILSSVLFNLASRSYALGIAVYIGLFLLFSILHLKREYKNHKKFFFIAFSVGAFALLLIVGLIFFLLSSDFADILLRNRTTGDFESVLNRIGSFYPIEQLNMNLPFLGGPGLGSTLNNSPVSVLSIQSYTQCRPPLDEWDLTRIICSLGYYGYFFVLIRMFVLILYWINFRRFRFSRIYPLPIYIAMKSLKAYLLIVLGVAVSLKQNDNLASTLLLCFLSISLEKYYAHKKFPLGSSFAPSSLTSNY